MPSSPETPSAGEAEDPLVRRAVDGDHDALDQLLRETTPDLERAIRIEPKWNRSLSVDDIVQVTYLEAFLRIRSLQKPTRPAFVAWLKRVADNNMIDAVRGLERKKRPGVNDRVTQGPDGQSARTLLMAVVGEQRTAGGNAALAEQIERMRDAITRLPKSYRTVVQQLELDQLPVTEVADGLGRTQAAVYMLRSRALDRLRELLREPNGA